MRRLGASWLLSWPLCWRSVGCRPGIALALQLLCNCSATALQLQLKNSQVSVELSSALLPTDYFFEISGVHMQRHYPDFRTTCIIGNICFIGLSLIVLAFPTGFHELREIAETGCHEANWASPMARVVSGDKSDKQGTSIIRRRQK